MAHFEVSQGYRSELKEIDGKLEVVGKNLNYFSVGGVHFRYNPKWPKTIDKALERAEEYAATLNRTYPSTYWEAMKKIKYMGPRDQPYIDPRGTPEFKKQSEELAKLVNIA